MSLRPRYSLLTLLVLTALVAGGVKLWYGPHHVVERTGPGIEGECTYTRDLFGNKIIHGPLVVRFMDDDASVYRIAVLYYRHGQILNWRCDHYLQNKQFTMENSASDELFLDSTMSREEYSEFKQAVAREVQKRPTLAPGMYWNEFESPDH
jgi:hypothetical protein